MRVKAAFLFCLLAGLAMVMGVSPVTPSIAQEGHPLVGTWYGDWGPSATHRNQITVIMYWDGKDITGIINPGPNPIPIKSAVLDSTQWNVRLEADATNQAGNTVNFRAEGKLEDIGSYNRTLTGTWSHGDSRGDFKITRD